MKGVLTSKPARNIAFVLSIGFGAAFIWSGISHFLNISLDAHYAEVRVTVVNRYIIGTLQTFGGVTLLFAATRLLAAISIGIVMLILLSLRLLNNGSLDGSVVPYIIFSICLAIAGVTLTNRRTHT